MERSRVNAALCLPESAAFQAMSWQCTPDCFGTEMLSLAGATLAKTGFYFARSDFRCYVGKERVIEQPTFHNVSKNSQNNNKRSHTTMTVNDYVQIYSLRSTEIYLVYHSNKIGVHSS